MAKPVRRRLFAYISCFLLASLTIASTASVSPAQSTLSPGDLMVVTVNSDSPDSFDFVPLIDLEAGTVIYFTDNAYLAAKNSLNDNEGVIRYTAPAAVNAGTVVSYDGTDNNGFVEYKGNFNASSSGDNLIAYQAGSDTTYIYGAGWARGANAWSYNGDTNRSDVPPGLSEADHTILSLRAAQSMQYDASRGVEGTPSALLARIGDEANWKSDNDIAYTTFGTSFTLLNPPALTFEAGSKAVIEDNGTATLTVKLVESDGTAVSVDVALLGGSSSAGAEDVGNYVTQTVRFAGSDTDGATRSVTVTLTDDGEYEGGEKAVFRLQNNDRGTILDPELLTLTILDDDTPDIVINEIHADPNGDANRDGVVSTSGDEFLELVNKESFDVNISGWTISDETSVRYTFPEGTVLSAGSAAVVFADTAAAGSFGGASLFTAGSLGLNNDGESMVLADDNGNIIVNLFYPVAGDNQSLNLDPDLTGENYKNHSEISGSAGSLFSPGTRVDGTAFGSRYAIGLRGGEGWRMIATPTQNTTFNNLLGGLWMQGMTASDNPAGAATVYRWTESGGGAYTAALSMTDNMTPGKGYIIYVFEDDAFSTPGIQGGFPKIIRTDESENSSPVSVPVSASDANETGSIDANEGWNLLGNPFGTDISVAELIDALEAVNPSVNANVYVWDPSAGGGAGAYITLSDGDRLAPFQAFWVRYTEAGVNGNVSLNRAKLAENTGSRYFKEISESEFDFDFGLKLSGDSFFDTYRVVFSDRGTTEMDRYDAYKLFSMNPNSINLYSLSGNNRIMKNVLPAELDSRIEIPLGFDAPDHDELTFSWEGLDGLPQGWSVTLIDRERNAEMDLSKESGYRFRLRSVSERNKPADREAPVLKRTITGSESSRFVLAITPASVAAAGNTDKPESVKLNPNYPNPFNPTTTISYELNRDTRVKLTVWNIVGQKVATLVDGIVEAGEHTETWNATDMPSGIYIAQLEVEGNVFIRKMTLIK